MKRKTIDIITLGCSKNLVDSEHLMRQLEEAGYHVTHDTEKPEGEIAVINTCGFIGDAKEESINMILEFAQAKEEGDLEKLYVMGCLSERYLKELAIEIPQVDKFYGKFNWVELLQDLGKAYHEELHIERTLTTPRHYAYLKISEGCDRKCSYCAIPIITGKHVSRPIEEILDEVRYLVSKGVKEFQVIAQELTYYGVDLYKKQMLPELIERISEVPGVEWIRLHYAYPAHFPMDLFRVMRERPNVCRYMDIALQHISNPMLEKMRRHVTQEETYHLIEQFRKEVPGIHLRTTLMVGHPGETEADFEELKDRLLSLTLEGKIVGFLHIINDALSDVVKSDEMRILYGKDYFYEEILGLRFKITPFSFFQPNSYGAEVLYETAREYIGDTKDMTVFDLYSGTGTISQILAAVAKEVIGVEIVEEAVLAAEENARLNGIGNCRFIAGDVLKVLDGIQEKPDFIVLDPPRDGIHPKALPKILEYGVEKMVYISCKPTSLARDLEMFLEKGYRVEKVCCVDQFCQTVHVETVCLLSNRKLKPDTYVKLSLDAEDYYRFRDAEDKVND